LRALSRFVANPWTRTGLLLVVLGFCAYGLDAEWPQVQAGLQRLQWYWVAASVVTAAAGSGCMMLAWRSLLADLGSPLPVLATLRISFLAQLGKYVPGAVWSFAAQVELGHDQRVPRHRGAASIAIALIVMVGVGLGVAALALPLASAHAARHYVWVLAVIPVIAVCLYPPVLGRLVNVAFALIRQPPLEQRPSVRGLGLAIAWSLAGWLLQGAQVWLIAADLNGGGGTRILLSAVGGYALAASAGLALIVFPGGIGVREVILITVLTPVMPRATAVVIALMTRVVTTASDVGWGGVALLVRRRLTRLGKHRKGAVRAVTTG
jgi:glycosyltransferase 2 family protein